MSDDATMAKAAAKTVFGDLEAGKKGDGAVIKVSPAETTADGEENVLSDEDDIYETTMEKAPRYHMKVKMHAFEKRQNPIPMINIHFDPSTPERKPPTALDGMARRLLVCLFHRNRRETRE